MEMMKWNKLFTRELTEEEKEVYGDRFDFMWDGKMPEIDEVGRFRLILGLITVMGLALKTLMMIR